MAEPYAVVPLRNVIAARMTEVKRNIPYFLLASDIEMDALLAMRERKNLARSNDKASVNDCLVKTCACVLMEHDEINVPLVDTALHRYQSSSVCHPGNRAYQTKDGGDRECISARGAGITRYIVGGSSCDRWGDAGGIHGHLAKHSRIESVRGGAPGATFLDIFFAGHDS
jgi:hypothetical protein